MGIQIKADQTLDCRGLLCPLPVIKTKQAIDKLTVGQVLEMTATDPGSVPDMEAWSRRTGHELLEYRKDDGLFTFYIRKMK
jgi:tRNA 2-thiouridine synthesizing protein A